ncbi:MAG: HD-GYP domain-containing protein [Candidatus Kerfeldbacteria bacterium]|jgi:fumarate reductase subunit D
MDASILVQTGIKLYKPQGDLEHTANFFLILSSINHGSVKGHVERVALLSDRVAIRLEKDSKAAFFAGVLHDIGKLVLPYELFDGHDISGEEYAEIKTHALNGLLALQGHHLFTALCAGLHHAMYDAGYGLTIEDFPKDWGLATIKKLLDIAMIVSICDFVDAFTHRKTKIKDGSDKDSPDLKEMLYKKYPNEHQVIDIALDVNTNRDFD